MKVNYKRKDLIKLIKAKNKKDYKFLLDEAVEMIRSLNGQFQKQKNYDYDEVVADFIDCSLTNECDDLLNNYKKSWEN